MGASERSARPNDAVGREESQVKKRIFMRFLPAGRTGFFRAVFFSSFTLELFFVLLLLP